MLLKKPKQNKTTTTIIFHIIVYTMKKQKSRCCFFKSEMAGMHLIYGIVHCNRRNARSFPNRVLPVSPYHWVCR